MFLTLILSNCVIDCIVCQIEESDDEICGLLIGRRFHYVSYANENFPLKNYSISKHSFAVNTDEFIFSKQIVQERGLKPLAFYHSHTHANIKPSFRDLNLPNLLGLPCVIFSLEKPYIHMVAYNKKIDKLKGLSLRTEREAIVSEVYLMNSVLQKFSLLYWQ